MTKRKSVVGLALAGFVGGISGCNALLGVEDPVLSAGAAGRASGGADRGEAGGAGAPVAGGVGGGGQSGGAAGEAGRGGTGNAGNAGRVGANAGQAGNAGAPMAGGAGGAVAGTRGSLPIAGSAGTAGAVAATGGTVAIAGSSGMGGAVGQGGTPPAECTSNPNCDDGNPCNGAETCVQNRCQPGTPAAACSVDTVHCRCVVEVTACVVRGLDADQDGHRDAACTQDTGADDCNDASNAAYPGATEICDGLDNDCNGMADVFDGLPVGGQLDSLLTMGAGPRAVWWPAANAYAVIVQNTGVDPAIVQLFLIFPTGSVLLGPVDMVPTPPIPATWIMGAIGVSGGTLGWLSVATDGATNPFLARFNTSGQNTGTQNLTDATYPSNVYNNFRAGALLGSPDGSFYAGYMWGLSGSTNAGIARWDAAGTQTNPIIFGSSLTLGASYDTLRAFASATTIATVGTSGAVLDIRQDLTEASALGANSTGFALQQGAYGSRTFSELSTGLITTCGPISTTNGIIETNFALTGPGWIGYTITNNIPEIMVVAPNCGTVKNVALSTAATVQIMGSTAAGPKGAIAVWNAGFAVNFRVMGPHLCDAPLP